MQPIQSLRDEFHRYFSRGFHDPRPSQQRRLLLAPEQLEQRNMFAAFSLLPEIADGEFGSLRHAVSLANTNHENDVIHLAAGTYRLSLNGSDEDGNRAGDIDLIERGNTVTIIGAGADSTFIDSEFLADRIIDVHSGTTLVLIGVTIKGGNGVIEGGGLKNEGTLELRDSTVIGNTADTGGGIFNDGTLTLSSSKITKNIARLGGGGIYNSGELAILDSEVSGNASEFFSADIWNAEATRPYESTIDISLIDTSYSIDTPFTTTIIYSSEIGEIDGGIPRAGSALLTGDAIGLDSLSIYLPSHDETNATFQAGSLTAGSIDDHESFSDFLSFLSDTLQDISNDFPAIELGELKTIRVTDNTNTPIGDALVTVHAIDAEGNLTGEPLLSLRTGSDGRILFSTGLDGSSDTGHYSVTVIPGDDSPSVTKIFSLDDNSWEIMFTESISALPTQLDIALVIDTTGSMSDELEFLKIEIGSIITQVHEQYPDVDIRLSLVSYRDHGDAYVTRSFDFKDSVEDFTELLEQQFAGGGGNYPEAMHLALEDALEFDWRENNTARMLFLVADAPPHDRYASRTLEAVNEFREKGVRIFPVAASGVAQKAEYIMRSAAFLTLGEYLFLTDQSGYGNPHAEPDVSEYDVERLDQLMIRMISSELAGKKIPAAEIIEHVETGTIQSLSMFPSSEPLSSRIASLTPHTRASLVDSIDWDVSLPSLSSPEINSALQMAIEEESLRVSTLHNEEVSPLKSQETSRFEDVIDAIFGEFFNPLVK